MKWAVPLVLAVLLAACSQSRQGDGEKVDNPFRGMIQDRTAASPDAALFVEKCGMCHRQSGMGTVILARRMDPALAMLEARDDLTADYVTTAARQGIGNMPRIGRGEVSDEQLARIADYLAKTALAKPVPEH